MRRRDAAPTRPSHRGLTLPRISPNLLVVGPLGACLLDWADARLLRIGLAALLAAAAYSLLGQGMAITLRQLRRYVSPPA